MTLSTERICIRPLNVSLQDYCSPLPTPPNSTWELGGLQAWCSGMLLSSRRTHWKVGVHGCGSAGDSALLLELPFLGEPPARDCLSKTLGTGESHLLPSTFSSSSGTMKEVATLRFFLRGPSLSRPCPKEQGQPVLGPTHTFPEAAAQHLCQRRTGHIQGSPSSLPLSVLIREHSSCPTTISRVNSSPSDSCYVISSD